MKKYLKIVNEIFLTNKFDFNEGGAYLNNINLKKERWIIRKYNSLKNDKNTRKDDQRFYTNKSYYINRVLEKYIDDVQEEYKKDFLTLLIIKVSTNACSVVKGFYKDKNTKIGKFCGTKGINISRIKETTEANDQFVLCDEKTECIFYQKSAVRLSKKPIEKYLAFCTGIQDSSYLILENKKLKQTNYISKIPKFKMFSFREQKL